MSERVSEQVCVGLVGRWFFFLFLLLAMWRWNFCGLSAQDKNEHTHSLIFEIMGTGATLQRNSPHQKQQQQQRYLKLRSFDGIKSAIKRNITNMSFFYTHRNTSKSCGRNNFMEVNQVELFSGGIITKTTITIHTYVSAVLLLLSLVTIFA